MQNEKQTSHEANSKFFKFGVQQEMRRTDQVFCDKIRHMSVLNHAFNKQELALYDFWIIVLELFFGGEKCKTFKLITFRKCTEMEQLVLTECQDLSDKVK